MLRFAEPNVSAIPLHILPPEAVDSWLDQQPSETVAWVRSMGFEGQAGQVCAVPNSAGGVAMALAGAGSISAQARGRFLLASAAARLPKGSYVIASKHDPETLTEHALGWLLSRYSLKPIVLRHPMTHA